jgi:hypothetical protein
MGSPGQPSAFALPCIVVVFVVCVNSDDINLMASVMDPDDEAILVSANIEDDATTYRVGRSRGELTDIGKTGPIRPPRDSIPGLQG